MKIFKKVRYPNGRRHIYFCGMKIFSYRKKQKLMFYESGKNNHIDVRGTNIQARINIYGSNNTVDIGESQRGGKLKIHIRGHNNKIHIMPSAELQSVHINIGNHMEISTRIC